MFKFEITSYFDSMELLTSEDLPELKRVKLEPKTYNCIKRNDRQRTKSRDYVNEPLKGNAKEIMKCLIFDSGAYSIKIGYSTDGEPTIIPNCIMKAKSERKRLFIGNQIHECRDCSGLYYLLPCERGYITKWDVQKPVWDYTFSKAMYPIGDNPVVMTQPLFNFKSIRDCTDEILFEEYEAKSIYKANPADFVALKYSKEKNPANRTCIVVDSGFSFTYVVPYIHGKKYPKGIKRISVGGKLLTNQLKDIISYRQYHVMEETYVINQVKEDTCYVAQDFREDLKIASQHGPKNHIIRNYVLPDFNNIRRGYIQEANKIDEVAENCQILRLNNERFTVPEILFHPSDIGLKNIGIAETIVKCIYNCPLNYQRELAKNIVVVGGNAKFSGFQTRLYAEIRSMLPNLWDLKIFIPDDPITYAWQGSKTLLRQPNAKELFVTKEEYDEFGSDFVHNRFDDWSPAVEEEKIKKTEIQHISLLDHLKKYNVFGKNTVVDVADELCSKKSSSSIDLSSTSTLNNLAEDSGICDSSTAEETTESSSNTEKSSDSQGRTSSSDSIQDSVLSKKSDGTRVKAKQYYTENFTEAEDSDEDLNMAELFPLGFNYV